MLQISVNTYCWNPWEHSHNWLFWLFIRNKQLWYVTNIYCMYRAECWYLHLLEIKFHDSRMHIAQSILYPRSEVNQFSLNNQWLTVCMPKCCEGFTGACGRSNGAATQPPPDDGLYIVYGSYADKSRSCAWLCLSLQDSTGLLLFGGATSQRTSPTKSGITWPPRSGELMGSSSTLRVTCVCSYTSDHTQCEHCPQTCSNSKNTQSHIFTFTFL